MIEPHSDPSVVQPTVRHATSGPAPSSEGAAPNGVAKEKLSPPPPSETPGQLLSSFAAMEADWKSYLNREVQKQIASGQKGKKAPGLSKETAGNYQRIVNRFLNDLGSGPADAGEEGLKAALSEPVTSTGKFLDRLAEQSSEKMRDVYRSTLLGKFLPWAVSSGHLELNLKEFDRLHPVSLEKSTFPPFELWIHQVLERQQGGSKGSVAQARMHLRQLALYVLEKKLGVSLEVYKKDARPLLRNEREGVFRMMRARGKESRELAEAPYPGPYASAMEWIHYDKNIVKEYADALAAEKGRRDLIKHNLSTIRRYLGFAHTFGFSPLTGRDVVNPLNLQSNGASSRAPRTPKPKKQQPGDPQSQKQPSRKQKPSKSQRKEAVVIEQTPPVSVPLTWYPPKERRVETNPLLQLMVPARDEAISTLIQGGHCNFSEARQLQGAEVSVDSVAASFLHPETHSRVFLDDATTKSFQAYRASLYAVAEETRGPLTVLAGNAPFFVATDGGFLTVDEKLPKGRRGEQFVQLAWLRDKFITAVIRKEGVPFEIVRGLSTDDLENFEFRDPELETLKKDYLQFMRISEFRSAVTERNGPRIAFPALDGGTLTGDSF